MFPLRLAAADIGSNAIRFLAVEFASRQSLAMLDQVRVPVRLGHDVFQHGRLGRDAIAAAVSALERFARRQRELRVASYRAVATSAVRESRNAAELIEPVRERTGTEIEPITGNEEARLVHRAVRSRVQLGGERWLLADLGGGSVEVSLVDRAGVAQTESYELGSVRLLEGLAAGAGQPEHLRSRLEEHMAPLHESRVLHTGNVAGLIATGGNIEALARLAGTLPDAVGVATLPVAGLRAVTERLAKLSYAERIRRFNLRADRADVILPAAIVYERIAAIAAADTVTVPNVGVRDGVVLDLLDRHARAAASDDQN